MDRKDIIDAHGGIERFYKAAAAKFRFSEAITAHEGADDLERLEWLRSAIGLCQMAEASCILHGPIPSALCWRALIRQLLDDMGATLERAKA